MNHNIAVGAECTPKRIELTARRFEEMCGKDALAAFLRAAAGVSRVEDVPDDRRFAVNRAMREHLHGLESNPINRIRAKAFARMVVRK